MQELQRTVAATGGISHWVIKKPRKKSMSMETRLAGFLGACVCARTLMCVCVYSQLGLHYACLYEWVDECE